MSTSLPKRKRADAIDENTGSRASGQRDFAEDGTRGPRRRE